MLRPNFWPEGSKIVDNPSQVAEILSREERSAKIAEIQKVLREQGKTLSEEEKKKNLADLFRLMEEDEIAREGAFEIPEEALHIPGEEEKDTMYAAESKATSATNDSIGGEDSRLVA